MLTFVPVPPSKAKGDPLYGDRLLQMLTALWPDRATDIGELVVQAASTEAVHDSDIRPTPAELQLSTRSTIGSGLRLAHGSLLGLFMGSFMASSLDPSIDTDEPVSSGVIRRALRSRSEANTDPLVPCGMPRRSSTITREVARRADSSLVDEGKTPAD